ncbi:MAG: hypothetical protein F6K48_13605 [Okeania sp. SIO3H1]|uniref:hypothetical protein n=1 Tax=Okeania sp. SIO1I7 TaxID=2607772 RepID=UPI0013CC0321|nr:hypothetical protein [Okeania sp. SIO1I7]NEN89886.1 hypothetical protein [Okeania sp. SIO3H1]NET24600.1 hypothetical protein [Okeania sp. SIO1I7]
MSINSTNLARQMFQQKKFIPVLSSFALMMFSVFLTTGRSPLAADCENTGNVKGGDVIFLRSKQKEDSEDMYIYIGRSDSGNNEYPTITLDSSMAVRFKVIVFGHIFENDYIGLQTIDKETIEQENWKESRLTRDQLGKFKDRDRLYYWRGSAYRYGATYKDYADSTKWLIERASDLSKVGPIQYNEEVYIINGRNGNILAPFDPPFLTAKEDKEENPFTWEFVKSCP